MSEFNGKDIADTLCMVAFIRALAVIAPSSETNARAAEVDTIWLIFSAHLLKARRGGVDVEDAVSEAARIARGDFATAYQKEVTALLDEWGFKQ